MPGGDGTGPLGFGPMTGRGAGFCSGYGIPGYANSLFGRGYRAFGRGRIGGRGGRGFRNFFYGDIDRGFRNLFYGGEYYQTQGMPFVTRTQEMDSLKAQAEYLEDMLETIQRRISELEGKIKDTNVQSG
ncbi:MAG TPA: DUF5320 domain-containing protein [Syntrophorhabdaceae bacterium]|nr:DUF5320 domain-containing protein [Syntrophorhabdaceae bacterium]